MHPMLQQGGKLCIAAFNRGCVSFPLQARHHGRGERGAGAVGLPPGPGPLRPLAGDGGVRRGLHRQHRWRGLHQGKGPTSLVVKKILSVMMLDLCYEFFIPMSA